MTSEGESRRLDRGLPAMIPAWMRKDAETMPNPEPAQKWRMVEPVALFPSHIYVTQARERRVGDLTQRIERVMVQPTDAYEYPGWRLIEVREGEPSVIGVETTLKDARNRADERIAR